MHQFFVAGYSTLGLCHTVAGTSKPHAPLEKGYVRVEQEQQWIRRLSDFDKEEAFEMIWKDGKVEVEN